MSIKNAKNKQVDGSSTADKGTTDEGKLYTYPESGFTIKATSRAEADKAHKKHIGQSEDDK